MRRSGQLGRQPAAVLVYVSVSRPASGTVVAHDAGSSQSSPLNVSLSGVRVCGEHRLPVMCEHLGLGWCTLTCLTPILARLHNSQPHQDLRHSSLVSQRQVEVIVAIGLHRVQSVHDRCYCRPYYVHHSGTYKLSQPRRTMASSNSAGSRMSSRTSNRFSRSSCVCTRVCVSAQCTPSLPRQRPKRGHGALTTRLKSLQTAEMRASGYQRG